MSKGVVISIIPIDLSVPVVRAGQGGEVLYKDVLLRLHEGTTHVVFGRSGVGKTSLFFACAKTRPIGRSGTLSYPVYFSPRTIVSGEDMKLDRFLALSSAGDHVDDWGLARSLHSRLSQLSLGEKTRLMMMLVAHLQPSIALLDEPTTGLDANGRRCFERLLQARRQAGQITLFSTHDIASVKQKSLGLIHLERPSTDVGTIVQSAETAIATGTMHCLFDDGKERTVNGTIPEMISALTDAQLARLI